jgi:hypothetical protein
MNESEIRWTDYMRHRAELRGFDVAKLEHVLRHSAERYVDTSTGRLVVVGRHGNLLVMMPYEREANVMRPITVHVTTRQQVRFRLKSGRYQDE